MIVFNLQCDKFFLCDILNVVVRIQKAKPRSGGKSIAVGEASAFVTSETHRQVIPPVLLRRAAQRSGMAQKNKRIMPIYSLLNSYK